jgi:hypothetical protein
MRKQNAGVNPTLGDDAMGVRIPHVVPPIGRRHQSGDGDQCRTSASKRGRQTQPGATASTLPTEPKLLGPERLVGAVECDSQT